MHGYPPRELAGTELYSQKVTRAMSARGWRVHVFAATRAPGRVHGELLEETLPEGGRLFRSVNNLPWRPLGRSERDRRIEGQIQRVLDEVRPDLVHVQHLLFLSAHLSLPVPTVATLHDAWGWCPRGGTLLREGIAPCAGPPAATPADCATCYAHWATTSPAEHALSQAAARLPVAPERLHAVWRRLPAGLRARALRGTTTRADPAAVLGWRAAVGGAFKRMDRRLAPSAWLARAAEAQGLGPVEHLPHGVAPGPPRLGGGGLLFLGTLAPHKGADLVADAWAQTPGLPPLQIVGPAVDRAYVDRLPAALVRPPLPPDQVPDALARARALVMGSRWPENAPLVALEARAAGCPVVAPAIGGLPELILDGVDGILYPPGDIARLGEALRAVCARDWAPRPPPTLAAHMDRLEAVYQSLL